MKNKLVNIHLITSLESGGAQKVLYDYLRSLNNYSSKNIEVYSLSRPNFYSKKIAHLGFEVIHLNKVSNWKRFISTIIFSGGYFKAWMYHACFISLLATLNFKREIYWSIHHGHVDFKSDSLSTIIFSKISAFFSWFVPKRVIFVSQACMNKHKEFGFNRSNTFVIYNNVDMPLKSLKVIGSRSAISFVGRDHPNKNIDLFLLACGRIDKIEKNEYIIAGNGTSRYNIDHGSNFHFWDEIECVEDVYSNTAVYVCTSYTESFGLTIIEAILSGCNVVCPSDPVFKEVTAGGEGNVYYYEQDDLESLILSINCAIRSGDVDLDYIESIRFRYSKRNTIDKMASLLGDQ